MLSNCDLVSNVSPLLIFCRYQMKCKSVSNVSPRYKRIGIESCLTSNIQTSTVASLADHPLKTFLEHGVLASLNTDDPAVQGVDIIHEYHVAAPAAGLSREQIRQAQINGLEIAFLSDDEKRALREKVAAA